MSLTACAERVQRGDPDRFLATMAAPVPSRRVLFALYAFNVEVARAPWVTEEAMIAEMRLQWWRDALAEIAAGDAVRAHEVTGPLADVLDAQGAQLLDRLVQARRWDIYRDPFEDAAHFAEYIDATSGQLVWAVARALGCTTGEAGLRDIGYAAGLANWLVAIPALEARGRVPLVDGRPEAIAELAAEGLRRLRSPVPRGGKAAVLACWRAKYILKRAKSAPGRVAEGALLGSEFQRRISLLRQSLLG